MYIDRNLGVVALDLVTHAFCLLAVFAGVAAGKGLHTIAVDLDATTTDFLGQINGILLGGGIVASGGRGRRGGSLRRVGRFCWGGTGFVGVAVVPSITLFTNWSIS